MKPKGLKRKHWWRSGPCLQQRWKAGCRAGMRTSLPQQTGCRAGMSSYTVMKNICCWYQIWFKAKDWGVGSTRVENHGKVYLHHFCLHSFPKLTVDLERSLSVDFSLGSPHPPTKKKLVSSNFLSPAFYNNRLLTSNIFKITTPT